MKNIHLTTLIFLWVARLSAAVLFCLLVSIIVGEDLLGDSGLEFSKMDWISRGMLLSWLFSMFGLLLILWREMPGGLVTISGMVVFYFLNYMASGQFPRGAFPLFFIPGVLAIVAWRLKMIKP
jgi:hypothetical protein